MSGANYKDAGVDIEAGHRAVQLMKAAVERTHGPRVLGGLGAFGGLFSATFMKEMDEPILVSSADGVGTKTKIASAMGIYTTVGQDIVNHCINDILVQGAEPLFFLDYVAASTLDPQMVADVVGGAAKACEGSGCALLGGETAEMPGVYTEGEFDLVGTIIGAVDRKKLITGERMEEGDVVLGLPSSGLHTNGFSLARKVLEGLDLNGPFEGTTLGEALLAPHRPYLAEVRALWSEDIDIRGLVHITGGGLIDNPPRILSPELSFALDPASWELPPLFRLIQERGEIADREMRHVFNCGVGLLVVVPAAQADAALKVLQADDRGGFRIGRMVARADGEPVRFEAAP